MPASTTRLTFYNGIMWQTVLLPDGMRAVWPCRPDGRPVSGGTVRYYRKPGNRGLGIASSGAQNWGTCR